MGYEADGRARRVGRDDLGRQQTPFIARRQEGRAESRSESDPVAEKDRLLGQARRQERAIECRVGRGGRPGAGCRRCLLRKGDEALVTSMPRVGVTAFAVLLAAACTREPAAPPSDEPARVVTTTAAAPPADLSEKQVQTTIPVGGTSLVTSVHVGSGDPGAEADASSIPLGAPITAILDTQPLPAGSVVRLLLLKDGLAVETQKEAAKNTRRVAVTNDDTKKLEPGEWTLQVWLGGTKVEERTIRIVGPDA
jgi:hypothetical protein